MKAYVIPIANGKTKGKLSEQINYAQANIKLHSGRGKTHKHF